MDFTLMFTTIQQGIAFSKIMNLDFQFNLFHEKCGQISKHKLLVGILYIQSRKKLYTYSIYVVQYLYIYERRKPSILMVIVPDMCIIIIERLIVGCFTLFIKLSRAYFCRGFKFEHHRAFALYNIPCTSYQKI